MREAVLGDGCVIRDRYCVVTSARHPARPLIHSSRLVGVLASEKLVRYYSKPFREELQQRMQGGVCPGKTRRVPPTGTLLP